MTRFLTVLAILTAPVGAAAQSQSLAEVAREAREAVLRGDLAPLVSGSRGLQVRLPGMEPSGALGPAQANATIRDLFRRGETSDVTIEEFREIGEGRAFVELRREFRVPGNRGRQVQRILLSYRLRGSGWQLVEIRAG